MKTRLLFFLAIVSISFMSCCEDESSNLDLHFKLEYGGEPLVMFEDVEYPDGKSMFFNRFSFYLSELKVGGQSVQTEAEYLDLTGDHTSLEKAENGYVYSITDLTIKEISNISFNIGLPASLNATTPSDYTSDNDLSLASEYWTPWSSYIFSKTEAKIDADNDGAKETNVALHLGIDDAFRSVDLSAALTLEEGMTGSLDILIDLKKLFEGPNGIYDIIAVPQIHQTNTMDELNQLADNMVEAISVR